MSLLEIHGLSKHFHGLQALSDVNLTVDEGEIVGIIGANGAGKTTLFNCVTGAFPPDSGTVNLDGKDITGIPMYRIARVGLARTFQLMRPFGTMTVVENAMVPTMHQHHLCADEARDRAMTAIAMVGIDQWADAVSGSLPAGVLKRLELARVLTLEPRVLLLDEVLAGLVPAERAPVLDLLDQLRVEQGITMVFIEHIMAAVQRLSDRVVMMDQGKAIATGNVDDVLSDPHVVEIYLGKEYHSA